MRNKEIDWDKSWQTSKEFTVENYMRANLRTLFDDEIVLDYENKVDAYYWIQKLKEKGYNFSVWDSGSRGIHVHIYITQLATLNENERIKYREKFIEKYGGDMSKKSGWLALEWRPHFKTGNIKTLISEYKGDNPFDIEMLIKIKKEIEEERRELKKHTGKSEWDILETAKKFGVNILGNKGDEYYGWFEPSLGKKHIWINVRKQVFFDFHRWEGGGSYQLYKLLKGM